MNSKVMNMENISCDWCESGSHKYIVVVDRAIVYLWAKEFPSLSSENTISMLTLIFATFGRPLEIRLDSGPAFRHMYEAAMAELGINVHFGST